MNIKGNQNQDDDAADDGTLGAEDHDGDDPQGGEGGATIEMTDDERRRARGDFVEGDQARATAEGKDASDSKGDGEGEAEGGKKKNEFVPHSVFNAKNEEAKRERARAEAAEAELARLRGGGDKGAEGKGTEDTKQDEQPVDLKALRRARADALYAGDTDKVLELEEQIEGEIERRAEARARQTISADTIQERVNEVAGKMIETYPFLDHQSPDRNEEAIDEVIALRDTYIRRGEPAHLALEKAVNKVGPMYAPKEKDGDSGNVTRIDKAADRRKQEREAVANVATRTPPASTGVSDRAKGGKIDVENLTDAQFNALPAEDKKRLRGDIVVG